MPALCFPSSGPADAAAVLPGGAQNNVPRPYNQGGYAGVIDAATLRDLQAEADSGGGAAVFAANGSAAGSNLLLWLAIGAGLYLITRDR